MLMLRQGFDVRTVQHWMGHKSPETAMRYLVPATDVHGKLDQVRIPGLSNNGSARSGARHVQHRSLEHRSSRNIRGR
jgi:hypothetical protein